MRTDQVFTTAIRNNAHVHIRVVFDSFVEQIPYPVTGIDCDNGSEFINHALIGWAATRVGVTAHGVVTSQPFEALTAAGSLVGPSALAHENLTFEGGIEGLGQRVARAGADGSHELGHTQGLAGSGEGLGSVDAAVVGGLGREVTFEQVGVFHTGLIQHGGAYPGFPPVAGDTPQHASDERLVIRFIHRESSRNLPLSSAVILGVPMAGAVSWTTRICSVRAASATARP